jgi:hypothetical protein
MSAAWSVINLSKYKKKKKMNYQHFVGVAFVIKQKVFG